MDAENAAQTAASAATAAAQAVVDDAVEAAQAAAGAAAGSAQSASSAAADAANAAAAAAESVISGAVSSVASAKQAAEQAQEGAEQAKSDAQQVLSTMQDTLDTAVQSATAAAEEAKGDAEAARDEAQGYASSMGQATAMAATFTSVPSTFQAWEIVVTQPHLRKMVWSSASNKYVRAPWHPVGQVGHFLRSIPEGFLEVRADVVLQKADFPDLAEYLGVTGSTFVLDEARGEFIRNADSGRGKDGGRTIGSYQSPSVQSHTHNYYFVAHTIPSTGGAAAINGVTGVAGVATGQIPGIAAGGTETRPGNLNYIFAVTF